MNNNEFYIGWMNDAPKSFAVFIKKYILVLLPTIIVLGIILSLSQKKFGKGTFEFGTLMEVKGVYFSKPIPNLKVANGKDIWGNASYITIPLIGYGKFGADGVISEVERENNESLNAKSIKVKGTLLYNDGKILMQVDGNDQPITIIAAAGNEKNELSAAKDLGTVQLTGEIVDPKCFFGVMKPGEGKPHKDCAIRCILGGIPPVLRVNNTNGASDYYFIVGVHGEKMNKTVQPYVAAPVVIKAKAIQYNDWTVLYIEYNGITEISKSALYQAVAAIACTSCK